MRGALLRYGASMGSFLRSALSHLVLRVAMCAPAALLVVHCGGPASERSDASSEPAAPALDGAVLHFAPDAGTRLPPEALVLGVCQVQSLNPGGTSCTGLDDVIECARDHCNVGDCVNACNDFLQCVQAAEDECPATARCPNHQACLNCIAENVVCAWSGACAGLFKCGSTTDGGACDKLEACCMLQSNRTACLGFVQGARMFSGDPVCEMFIHEPGFLKAYASEVPCTF